MKVRVAGEAAENFETPLLAIPIFENETESLPAAVRELGDFRGKPDETLLTHAPDGFRARRVMFVGLGPRERITAERVRRAAGSASKQASKVRCERLAFAVPSGPSEHSRAAAEGAVLGAYRFSEMKAPPKDEPAPVELAEIVLLGGDAEAARVGEILARAENLARTLGNLPPNVCTPAHLAETAQRIAAERGLACTVLGPAELKQEGMGALLAVAQGSAQEPRLIVLEHRGGGEGEPPLALVGKGLTFDAGGISIKPAQSMEDMKFDMCGGAAVLAAMQAVGELQVRCNVVGLVPASENLLGSAAMRPGDILRTHAGKSVEVVNTDAEGRLILADALSYLRRFEPAACVDAATLTGACVIGLGHHATGAMGNDEAVLEQVRAAGERAGQRVWPLPMWDEYREQLRSDYADLKNVGGRPAGAITAGWFLREFVGDTPWVHLDVAGTAYGDGKLSYQTKGATGVPTRLFVEWVLSRAG